MTKKKRSQFSTRDFKDLDTVGKVLENYRPWCRVFVRNAMYGQIGRRIDESDVIQVTWLDAVSNLEQFRGDSEAEFFSWLKKILENNLKNAIKEHLADKRDFRREQDFSFEMDVASIHWWEPMSPEFSPSKRLLEGERAIELAKAIELLPPNQRMAIELRHLQGLKLSQVCSEMDKTTDAVVSLIRRGIERLASILDCSEN